MVEIKEFKKESKNEELGKKICQLVEYYEQRKGPVWELAALADVLFAITRILKSYDELFKGIEERLKEKERMIVN